MYIISMVLVKNSLYKHTCQYHYRQTKPATMWKIWFLAAIHIPQYTWACGEATFASMIYHIVDWFVVFRAEMIHDAINTQFLDP